MNPELTEGFQPFKRGALKEIKLHVGAAAKRLHLVSPDNKRRWGKGKPLRRATP